MPKCFHVSISIFCAAVQNSFVTMFYQSPKLQFAPSTNSKEFHIEYEWRIDSGETSINSAHNTLSLKRLFNLGHTEFQRLSKQVKIGKKSYYTLQPINVLAI